MSTIDELRRDLTVSGTLHGQKLQFHTTWGLFSPKAIDEGSQLLADHFADIPANATTLDLGCGYGPLGLTLAKLAPAGEHQLVDKDFVAVEYAARYPEKVGRVVLLCPSGMGSEERLPITEGARHKDYTGLVASTLTWS